MSVHRALGNDDILDEIFGCFQLLHISQGYRSTIAVPENYRRRVTLAHLARVCTVFYEPAVRTLWRRLSNISPLLNLLHSSVSLGEGIRSVEDTGWHGEYEFVGDVYTEDWVRLRKYATYVQAVGRSELYIPGVQYTITDWSVLQRLCGDQPFLPNLRELAWTIVPHNSPVTSVVPLLCPTIAKVSLQCHSGVYRGYTISDDTAEEWLVDMKQFTEGLLQRCPRLAEIFVEIVGLPLASILVPLCGLAGTLPLQNFSVSVKNSTLNLPALKNLTHLSVLKSLKVAGICHVTRTSPLHFLRLDALQELVVTWHVLGSIPAVLTSTSLRSLSIKDIASVPCESGGQSMLRNICTKLTKAFPALEDLTLSLRQPEVSFGGRPRRSGRYHCAEAADVLEPLLDHVSLRVVNLSTSRIFLTLSDDDVDRFARASPSLRRLYMTVNGCLGPSRAFYREPETVSERCARLYSVGLPALVSLARHCPDLEVLHLEFVHIRGEDVARLPAEPPCHGLHNLEITSGCVARGAYQLIRDRIFPNIDMPR